MFVWYMCIVGQPCIYIHAYEFCMYIYIYRYLDVSICFLWVGVPVVCILAVAHSYFWWRVFWMQWHGHFIGVWMQKTLRFLWFDCVATGFPQSAEVGRGLIGWLRGGPSWESWQMTQEDVQLFMSMSMTGSNRNIYCY